MKPELISFKVCPFVQRSAITLNEKGIEYTMTYIDLQSPPACSARYPLLERCRC